MWFRVGCRWAYTHDASLSSLTDPVSHPRSRHSEAQRAPAPVAARSCSSTAKAIRSQTVRGSGVAPARSVKVYSHTRGSAEPAQKVFQ